MRAVLSCLLALTLFIAFGVSSGATTATFTPTGSMLVARAGHQAILLLDSRVLVTGGYDNAGTAVARAEVFSAATGTWSAIASNVVARTDHVATRLLDGRVLVVGGAPSLSSCSPNANAEIYDPATNRWALTGDLPIAGGTGMIAILLGDGRVLTSGGNRCGRISSTAALFTPSTNTWSVTAGMEAPRAFHSAVLLADARVLVTGGTTADGTFSTAEEVYDSATATWTAIKGPRPPRGISCGGCVQTFLSPLSTGAILAAGGIAGDCASGAVPAVNADLFDPTDLRWSPTGKLEIARALTTGTLLPDGRILVAGGYTGSGNVQSSTEFFDPAAGGWSLLGALHTARAGHTATRLANGTVLIAGGSDGARRTRTAEIYVPEISYAAGPLRVWVGGWDRRTGGHLNGPARSVATNTKGRIFIAYAPGGERRIVEWLPNGGPPPAPDPYVRDIGTGPDRFHSIRVDQQDKVWAIDESTNMITKFDPEGRVLLQFGRRPPSADIPEPRSGSDAPTETPYLNRPTDVTWDSAGNVFVSDGGNGRIVKYDAAGHFIASVGRLGSARGEMQKPHSIAADANGHVYVADGGNARIQVFDHDLRLFAVYDAVGSPWALCITRGAHQYLYAASNEDRTDATRGRSSDQVYKLELDGTIVARFGRPDNALGRFPTLHSIDCRRDNEIVAIGVGWAGVITLQP